MSKPAEEPASEPAEEPADEPASGGSGTATLTLDDPAAGSYRQFLERRDGDILSLLIRIRHLSHPSAV